MLSALGSQPPTPRPLHAAWSPMDVPGPDGTTDSWLVVGTGGSGAWRGRVGW